GRVELGHDPRGRQGAAGRDLLHRRRLELLSRGEGTALGPEGGVVKGVFSDFRKFLLRGNVLDLAVGVIIRAACGGATTALGDDVMMPPIGLALGHVDFKELYVPLVVPGVTPNSFEGLRTELLDAAKAKIVAQNEQAVKDGKPPTPVPTSIWPTLEQANAKGIPTLRYGLVINTIINFVFVAFGVFLIVKLVSLVQKKAPPPGPTQTQELLAGIR